MVTTNIFVFFSTLTMTLALKLGEYKWISIQNGAFCTVVNPWFIFIEAVTERIIQGKLTMILQK